MAERESLGSAALRWLVWALRILLFVAVVAFALRNSESVTLRLFPGYEWQASLVLVLLAFFAAGAAFGLAALLPMVFRQRRRIGRLEREAAARARDASPKAPPPELLH